MTLKDINKQRTAIMGVAAILVMMVHLWVSAEPLWSENIRRFCQNGVDIFLLLSGIGCYYSMSKRTISDFYKRRVLRILPVYFTVSILYGAFQCYAWDITIWDYFCNNSLLSFFVLGVVKGWFIGAILVLYSITPLLYKLLQKNKAIYWTIFAAIIIISSQLYFYSIGDTLSTINELFFTRIPIYMLGLMAGDYIQQHEDKEIKFSLSFIFISIGVLTLFFLNSWFNPVNKMGMTHYISILLAPILVIWLAKLFHRFECPVLKKIGSISLETYLVNEKITFILVVLMPITDYYLVNLFGFILTIIVGLGLHQIFNFNEREDKRYGTIS